MTEDPTIGRIVHYHSAQDGPCQAATIVKVWSPETVNLVVFPDGSNDRAIDNVETPEPATAYGTRVAIHSAPPTTYWATSAQFEDEPGTKQHAWHWPERVE